MAGELIQLMNFAVALKVIVSGMVAGAIAYIGIYWREKKRIEIQVRTERSIAMLLRVTHLLVEAHDHLHPEAQIGTAAFIDLLVGAGVRAKAPHEDP